MRKNKFIKNDIENLLSIQKRVNHLSNLAKEMYLIGIIKKYKITFLFPKMSVVQFKALASDPDVIERLSQELEDNGLITRSDK
ncbi:hypothetical protein [Companilactobacillus jidongensis]|uniref:hypothetical protein n=1 Tax=Companilactobacillus jidongensis TaxID=2486006 RepID=UPI000F7A0A4A|nr:hypothetical protein [Companilactobacillus jidongensis]